MAAGLATALQYAPVAMCSTIPAQGTAATPADQEITAIILHLAVTIPILHQGAAHHRAAAAHSALHHHAVQAEALAAGPAVAEVAVAPVEAVAVAAAGANNILPHVW